MHALKISQTRASRSLKILFDAGFLKMREEGSFTLYSIKQNRSNRMRALLMQALEEDFGRSSTAKKERERLKTAKRFDCKAVIKAKYKTLPDVLPQHDCCSDC
jgi:DNA-binding transcriptional ArsR family regulator